MKLSTQPLLKRIFVITKVLGTLVCWSVFFFWAFQALEKFISRPVSTSISVLNGDDGMGNLVYPAITICVSNLDDHLDQVLFYGDVKHCSFPGHNYYQYLAVCTSMANDGLNPSTSTTRCLNKF